MELHIDIVIKLPMTKVNKLGSKWTYNAIYFQLET